MRECAARLRFIVALLLLCLCMLSSTSALLAQEQPKADAPAAEAKERPLDNPVVHFFRSIGIVFGIIFAAISMASVALIIVLMMDLRMGEAVPPAFVDEFTDLINKRQYKPAFEICKREQSYLGKLMLAGMARLQYSLEDARESMVNMGETVRAQKENLISYLGTVGTLGPLLGLVGTVSGMIGAFRKLGASTGAPNASELASEISHALVVTLVGVALAVPAIFFYQFFKNRLTNIAMNTTNLADDLLTQIYHNSKKAPEPVVTPAAVPSATVVK